MKACREGVRAAAVVVPRSRHPHRSRWVPRRVTAISPPPAVECLVGALPSPPPLPWVPPRGHRPACPAPLSLLPWVHGGSLWPWLPPRSFSWPRVPPPLVLMVIWSPPPPAVVLAGGCPTGVPTTHVAL